MKFNEVLENTTEMNPFIILLVQNATKCIFHTQES